MSLLGPLVVVGEAPAPDLVEALSAAGAFPVVESGWAEAPAAFTAIQPAAVVTDDAAGDAEAAHLLGLQLKTRNGPFVPLLARMRLDAFPAIAEGLPIDAAASPDRLVARLRSALRVRALHATVLRRAETLAAQSGRVARFPDSDPLDDATILVTGRGGSYPALAVAVGERVGLIGSLSIETAARYLNARPIDGVIISDGFGAHVIEAFLTALAEDARFRDMPVAVLCAHPGLEPFYPVLANLERLENRPAQVLDWMLPLVRLRAFEARLKRMLKTIDAQGMLDAETGLLTEEAFWNELARAVHTAGDQGNGLCIARFSFAASLDRRLVKDAARLIEGAVRKVDFACQQPDGAIVIVFTETELQAAHLIARRLADMLRRMMPVAERDRRPPAPDITLATLRPTDTVETLTARIGLVSEAKAH